jgi:glycosyltransferase involved in cell wall biosynthesis
MHVNISAAIITFNESLNIERCIQSLRNVADEIVIVDSGSTDKTVDIAKALGARVIAHTFEGHIEQKNFAISQCASPYVLSLDADEVLTNELQESIKQIKFNWKYDGYYLNRCTNYCGRWIKHGSWYPDWKLRLWDSRKGAWGGQNPHDKFNMQAGATKSYLKGDLLHYSYPNISGHLLQMDKFTDIAAGQLFSKGKKATFTDLHIKPWFHFIKDYYLQRGFMDGWQGYTVARLSAMERVVRYSKLKDLYRLRNNDGNIPG